MKTGCPPRGSLYDPTTQPPAFSIAFVTSAAAPEGSVNRHSAGARPFVLGLALRGRFRAGARFTIAGTHSSSDGPFLVANHCDHQHSLTPAHVAFEMKDLL